MYFFVRVRLCVHVRVCIQPTLVSALPLLKGLKSMVCGVLWCAWRMRESAD